MGSPCVAPLIAAVLLCALGDPQVEAAIRALRKDSSLKVRTQAALVLGQRSAAEAVDALRAAVAEDDAASVRIAAVGALAKIGDRRARPTLRNARAADPDDSVRRAAARALAGLGPLAVSIDDPSGPVALRDAFRDALARELKGRGYAVAETGDVRLKPTLTVDVDERGGKTVVAVRASLVAVDGDGRAELVEAAAKGTVPGSVSESRLAGVSAKVVEAAARSLCDDLAAKLAER
jgi:hypothetical protein